MKKIIFIFSMLAALQIGCSASRQTAPNQTREIVFDDRLKIAGSGQTSEYENALYNGEELQDSTKKLADNSTLNIMFDGAGNKTETRFFDNHPLIKTIILRTSAKGEKRIFVYAQNGEIANLPHHSVEKALTAPANELSAAAGIFQPRKSKEFFDEEKYPPPNVDILQPLPSYEFLPEKLNADMKKSETSRDKRFDLETKETEKFAPWIEDEIKSDSPN